MTQRSFSKLKLVQISSSNRLQAIKQQRTTPRKRLFTVRILKQERPLTIIAADTSARYIGEKAIDGRRKVIKLSSRDAIQCKHDLASCKDNSTPNDIRDPKALLLECSRTGRFGQLKMSIMYVTIHFLSCCHIYKAYLLDSTRCVLQLGFEIQTRYKTLWNR